MRTAWLWLVTVLLLAGCGEPPAGRVNAVQRSPFAQADSLRDEGRFLKAHPLYRSLRDSFAVTADSGNLWRAQVWWAYTLIRNNRTDSAMAALEQAMEWAKDDAEREAWTRWVRCSRLSRIGQSDSAIDECARALTLAENIGNDELQARVHHQLGTIHSRLGHYRIAVDQTERTLALHRRHSHSRRQMIGTFNSMGIEYAAVGRLSEAEQMYEEGLHLADSLDAPWERAILQSNLAYLRLSTGDLPAALRLMTESLEGAAQLPDTQSMVYAYNSLAEFYLMGGNRAAARHQLEQSLAINRGVASIFRVIALLDLGMLEVADSNIEVADRTLKTAMMLADTAGFGLQRAKSRAALSRLEVKRGRALAALRWADAAVSIADSLEAPDAQIEAMEARAAALEAAGRSDASDGYMKSIELLESWRGRLALGDLRMGVAEPRWAIYEGAIRTLLANGRESEALMVAERARARLLLEVMAERDASRPPASPLEAVARLLRVRFEERAAVQRPAEQAALDRQINELTDSLSTLERLESARYPKPESIDRIRHELLNGDRALLTFFWGDDQVYGWWVTADTVHSATLGSADSLSAQVEFLSATIDRAARDTGWVLPARRAFDRLILPLHPGPAAEILVVPDGPLAHLPLEVLIPAEGAPPWGTTVRFTYGPSATVLLTLQRRPNAGAWERTMLALGGPAASGQANAIERSPPREEASTPLPFAGAEARAVRELYRDRGADLLVGSRATLERWLALDPSRYRYLHFAAHARVSDRQPEETHLVLSEGNLDLAGIRRLRLNAELVTLSACETALGRRVRGEGIVGLPHAFLSAGARGAVVTLWRIGDRSAADFMGEFYRELHAGRPPADALLAVRRRWVTAGGETAHPAHWAPFVLVGGM